MITLQKKLKNRSCDMLRTSKNKQSSTTTSQPKQQKVTDTNWNRPRTSSAGAQPQELQSLPISAALEYARRVAGLHFPRVFSKGRLGNLLQAALSGKLGRQWYTSFLSLDAFRKSVPYSLEEHFLANQCPESYPISWLETFISLKNCKSSL